MKSFIAFTMLTAVLLAGCSNSVNGAPPVQKAPSVVFEKVEMRAYTGAGGHPYVHSVISNHTDKTITDSKYGLVAYDKDGNPLEIDWNPIFANLEPAYSYFSEEGHEIDAGATRDVDGGWSLNFWGTDHEAEKIAHVLYCYKEITFDDGTVWHNPGYEGWLSQFEGNNIDVDILENYYPYVLQVDCQDVA